MGAAVSCIALNLCECAACMACTCCAKLVSFTLSQVSRFAHLLIVLTVFILAIILGKQYPNDINGYNYYTKIDLTSGCNSGYEDNCIYRQLIYRASFSCFMLFTILAIGTYFSDYLNRSLWIIKFGFAIGIFISFWWADNSFFSGWAEACRIFSFFWLLIQGLLLIDFSHDAHDILMNDNEGQSSPSYGLYIGSSISALFLAVLGIVYLFMDYTGCDIGMFYTVLTLIVAVITTIVSLLESVGGGLLTPCLVAAYSVFMCWYALLSNPDRDCNPTADSVNGTQNSALVIVSAVSIVILLYCVFNGTKILNVFNPDGEGVMMSYNGKTEMSGVTSPVAPPVATKQPSATGTANENSDVEQKDSTAEAGTEEKSSGTPPERAFYHVLLMLVSCYGAMILTNWGKTNGAPASEGSHKVSDESMWLKILSQWVFLILYCKTLHVHYINNENNGA